MGEEEGGEGGRDLGIRQSCFGPRTCLDALEKWKIVNTAGNRMTITWSSSPYCCQYTDGAIPVSSVLHTSKSFIWGNGLSFWPACIKNSSEGFYLSTPFITEIIQRNLVFLLYEWCWDEQIKQNQTGRTCSALRKALEACRSLVIEPHDGTKHRLKDLNEKNLVSSEMIFQVFCEDLDYSGLGYSTT